MSPCEGVFATALPEMVFELTKRCESMSAFNVDELEARVAEVQAILSQRDDDDQECDMNLYLALLSCLYKLEAFLDIARGLNKLKRVSLASVSDMNPLSELAALGVNGHKVRRLNFD